MTISQRAMGRRLSDSRAPVSGDGVPILDGELVWGRISQPTGTCLGMSRRKMFPLTRALCDWPDSLTHHASSLTECAMRVP